MLEEKGREERKKGRTEKNTNRKEQSFGKRPEKRPHGRQGSSGKEGVQR